MDALIIQGGARLRGKIRVNGSKNAALPLMAASILTDAPVTLREVPHLSDIASMRQLLTALGVKNEHHADGSMVMQVVNSSVSSADYSLVSKMRASICTMGPLLAKRKVARVSMPGGCAIGDRPIDLHLRGMQALGAKMTLDKGDIILHADRLIGAEIFLGGNFGSTVLGTANVMSAATLAKGTTVIESAACEPEITDLANLLIQMGAKITGAGSPRIIIEGVEELHGVDYTIIPDRIEAGTFMVAAAITNGEVELDNVRLEHLLAVVDKLRQIGVIVEKTPTGCIVSSIRRLNATSITTQPYPGFPTDLQAQFMALLCLADGNSIVTEKIYPDRFLHVAELSRLGAHLHKEASTVVIEGERELIGAQVMASDLRASAALVLAGLVARGETTVSRVYHIDRGYEKIETRLNALGAKIKRVDLKDA